MRQAAASKNEEQEPGQWHVELITGSEITGRQTAEKTVRVAADRTL